MTDNNSPPAGRWRCGPLVPLAVAGGVLVLCAVTVRDFGLTYDEPRYIENTRRMQAWFAGLATDGVARQLAADRITEGWYYARTESKNLPLVSIVSAIGEAVGGRFDSPPASHRWGNLLVFAITCGVMFSWVRQELSTAAAVIAVAALLGIPRVLAHAQLLSIDPLVACFWVLATWALWYSRRGGWGWPILFGVLAGIGATAKPTFWFAVPAWIAWVLLVRPPYRWRALGSLGTLAPLTALLLVPMWWSNPLGGFIDYLDLLRNDPVGWKIDVYYLGEIYQAEFDPRPLPWHSVPLLAAVTTPLWIGVLLLAAVVGWTRDAVTGPGDPAAGSTESPRALEGLWLISAIMLPIVVMLPMTPAHDGTRLYRPACFFVALLAAAGFERVRRRWVADRPRILAAATAVLLIVAGWTSSSAHPAGLSYYNLLVGGFQGATEPQPLGLQGGLVESRRPLFEISYWWELLDKDALADLQDHLPPDARVTVFPEHGGLELLKQWRHIRDDIEFVDRKKSDWVLMYGRLGRLLDPRTDPYGTMFLHEKPAWEHRVGDVRVAALFRLRSIGPAVR